MFWDKESGTVPTDSNLLALNSTALTIACADRKNHTIVCLRTLFPRRVVTPPVYIILWNLFTVASAALSFRHARNHTNWTSSFSGSRINITSNFPSADGRNLHAFQRQRKCTRLSRMRRLRVPDLGTSRFHRAKKSRRACLDRDKY